MHEVRKKDGVIKADKNRKKKKEDVQLQKDQADVKILYQVW